MRLLNVLSVLCLSCALGAAGSDAPAQEVGTSDFKTLSELLGQGYEPFATSGVGNISFGMKQDAEMYLCLLADTPRLSGIRNEVLMAELGGENPDRAVPNIPVICVLTQ